MNKRRLLKLAEFLETAELPGKFRLKNWADIAKNERPACGTSACAIGWATTIPSFRRAGFALGGSGSPWPDYMGAQNWDAVNAFFCITYGDAHQLFSMQSYPESQHNGTRGRNAVAKRIRKLVASAP